MNNGSFYNINNDNDDDDDNNNNNNNNNNIFIQTNTSWFNFTFSLLKPSSRVQLMPNKRIRKGCFSFTASFNCSRAT